VLGAGALWCLCVRGGVRVAYADEAADLVRFGIAGPATYVRASCHASHTKGLNEPESGADAGHQACCNVDVQR